MDMKGGCIKFGQLEFMLVSMEKNINTPYKVHFIIHFSSVYLVNNSMQNMSKYTNCISIFMHDSCTGSGMLKSPADSHQFSSGMKLQTIYSHL